MKFSRSVCWLIPAALLALVVTMFFFGQSPAGSHFAGHHFLKVNTHHAPPVRDAGTASALLGKSVEGENGDTVGTIDDLVIDSKSGRIVFVVLASGGFAGMGVRLTPVPPGALSQATAKRDILALNLDLRRWAKAPRINKRRLADFENPTATRAVYQYYHQPWISETGRTNGNSGSPADSGGMRIGRLQLARDLIGQSVLNDQNQEMGRVSDLSVDLTGPAQIRATFEPNSGSGKFSLPLSVFIINGGGGALILNSDPAQFHRSEWAAAILRAKNVKLPAANPAQNGF